MVHFSRGDDQVFRPRLSIASILLASIVLYSSTAVCSQDASAVEKPADSAEADSRQARLTSSDSPVLTLGDLRDVGLSIMLIQQLAKNIYLEVTRKPVPASASPHIEDLKLIKSGNIEDASKYEPVRSEWIQYYVGTMEPIVHLLQADIDNTKSGAKELLVPKGTKAAFQKLLNQYDGYMKELNDHISEIFEDRGDSKSNVAIAQEAVKLYDVTEKLESIRKKGFNLIKKAREGELEDVTPEKR